MSYHDWLALAVCAMVGVFAVAIYAVMARTKKPVSAIAALAIAWFGLGVPVLVLVPVFMIYAIKTGAYDPVRDDGMSLVKANSLPGHLSATIILGLAITAGVVVIGLADAAFRAWSNRRMVARARLPSD